MPRLLHDRYFDEGAGGTLDIVTGRVADAHVEARPPVPDTPENPLRSLGEVLAHGREGTPRWITANAAAAGRLRQTIDAAAREALRHGFVAVAADLYVRLRNSLGAELHERSLLLIAAPSVPPAVARAALADAASRSSRPHVLLTLQPRMRQGNPRSASVVREARAIYGTQQIRRAPPLALAEDVARHLQRAARAGDFVRAGRHAAAERLLRDVVAALERRRAAPAAARTAVTLGRHLLERGRAAAAEEVFSGAAALAAPFDEAVATSARIWQAAARTDCAQLSAAESLCRAALTAGVLDDGERARGEATLARVLLWQGRVDEAARLPFVEGPPTGAPFVDATAVRVLLAAGDLFAAGLRAREIVTATAATVASDPLGRVIALAAHIRVLLAAGDFVAAEACLHALRAAAREARAPLRTARVSLVFVDALRRAGRTTQTAALVRHLERYRAASPPLLREAIERRVRNAPAAAIAPPGTGFASPRTSGPAANPRLATSLVLAGQRESSDADAVAGIVECALETLRCSRVDVLSADAGPPTCLLSVGTGLQTNLGPRVLEAGITVGPEEAAGGRELGVPVRLGEQLLAAIVARWPADAMPHANAGDVLHLTAAVAAPRLASLLSAARERAHAATAIPDLIGVGAAMTAVRQAVVRAAASPFAVLIEGESGSGKELVARAIHLLSPRRERRLCDVNCAALPDDLIDAELFGHTRGAFTGAVADRAGLVEEADGGTLFLDEVLDLSARAQAKLLRVIQQQEVRRVGETFARKVDVRIVSAANRDIRAEAAAGRFRHDLLYRLDVIRIQLPPLRERPEDIPVLAEHFWRTAAGRVGTTAALDHAVLAGLARYHWPGNVRELQNVIAALAVAAPARGQVRAALLPAAITGAAAVTSARLADARTQFERRFIEVALARAGGSRTRAAREIGLTRQGLLKLMARLGVA